MSIKRPWLRVRIAAERIHPDDGHHEVQLAVAILNDEGDFLFSPEITSDRWLRLSDSLTLHLDAS